MKKLSYHVIPHDIEVSCYTCDKPTRFYVFEFDVYLCMDCIKILSSVEIINKRILIF
ncbi:hypothetical protein L0244_38645 [bacterium]|nr:hypothetical protein [bacterium]